MHSRQKYGPAAAPSRGPVAHTCGLENEDEVSRDGEDEEDTPEFTQEQLLHFVDMAAEQIAEKVGVDANKVADISARFKHNASYAIGSRLGEKLFSKREVRKLMLTVAEECAKCMCGTAVETSH